MLKTYFQENFYDMPVDVAQKYANAIRDAIMAGKDFEAQKKKGFFLSTKRGFDDKLYVGNIHRIEDHLYYRDEQLSDDDQIINVVVIDGPVTRDGDGCSYGSKDHRNQVLYANTIPQVVGHVFIINTPGGAASARIDYEQAIADCREKGKATVAWVDGLCASAGQLVAAICDRTIVMNGRHTMGCIGTMCAFWGVPNGTTTQDGFRYIELVSVTSPDKNAEYREAVDGKTEKLQAELDRLGEEFRETVRQNRPNVKEEHLTGKTFEAQEVMGSLVDEIGDYNRALQAVFDLAEGNIKPAREVEDMTEQPGGEGEQEEQKDLATLNAQQKGAIAANAGIDVEVEDGHVSTTVQTMFGPEKKEIATPKNQEDMSEKEKQEMETKTVETPVEEKENVQEAPAEQPADETEQPAGEGVGEKSNDSEGAPADGGEEKPADEDEQPADGEGEGEKTADEDEKPADGEGEGEQPADGGEEKPADEQPSEQAAADAQKEIKRISDTLHNAEQMIAEKDGTIEQLNQTIEQLSGTIAQLTGTVDSQKETIDQLTQRVASLDAEIKELSENPAPMVNASNGIPASNGAGAAPKANKHTLIKPGMSYKQIRAIVKQK